MGIPKELLDQLLAVYSKPEDRLGPGGVFDELRKASAERALGAELTHHLETEREMGGGPITATGQAARP